MFNAVFFESAGFLSTGSKTSAPEKKAHKVHSALTCGVSAPRSDNTIFAGRQDGEVVAWLMSRGKSSSEEKPSMQSKLRVLGSHKGSVTCLGYYPARKLLFSGSSDSQVAMWDPFQVYQRSGNGPSASRLQLIPAHEATVTAMAVHCNVLVTGSVDKTVKIWMFDDRRDGLAIPLLIAKQAFVFDNWVTTIFSTLTKATEVQAEDIFIGDASGNVTTLHSVMTPMLQKGSVEDNGVLQVELVRHKKLAEGSAMPPGSGDAVPKSITSILPIPTVNSMVTLGFGHCALITDAVKGTVLGKIEHPECVGTNSKHSVATRFGGVLFLALREEMILLDNIGGIFLWDTRTNQFLCQRSSSGNRRAKGLIEFPSHGSASSYLRSTDEQFLILHDDGIEIVNVVHVRAVTELKGHEGRVIGIQVNHLSEYAALSATGDDDNSPSQGHGNGTETQDVAFVTAGVDNKVCLWSSRLSLVRSFNEKFSEISSFCFLPHLDFCITGHDNGSVKFWGLGSERSSRFTAHDNTISTVAEGLHKVEKRNNDVVPWHHLFTISYDGCLAVWEMPVESSKPKCEGRVRVSNSELVCGVYDPINHGYIVGDNDGVISMWSIDELKPLRRFQHSQLGSVVGRFRAAHCEAVTTIALDGNIAVSGSEDTRIFLWNTQNGECLKEFNTTAIAPEYTAAARSGWGDIQQLHVNNETGDLIACTRSGVVLQFDQASGLPVAFYKAQSEISALCINPYGREVILGLESGLVVRAPTAMFKPLTVTACDDVE